MVEAVLPNVRDAGDLSRSRVDFVLVISGWTEGKDNMPPSLILSEVFYELLPKVWLWFLS